LTALPAKFNLATNRTNLAEQIYTEQPLGEQSIKLDKGINMVYNIDENNKQKT
jgi:hypothetical protein